MKWNRLLALSLSIVSAAIFAAAAIGVICWPDESLKQFDTAWLRVVLLAACALLSVVAATHFYILWHDPMPARMVRLAIYAFLTAGLAGSAAPFGYHGVQNVRAPGVAITFQDATYSSVVFFGAMALGLVPLLMVYAVCRYGEHFATNPPERLIQFAEKWLGRIFPST